MTQRGLIIVKAADPVGAAMRHRVEHRFELPALDRTTVEIEYGGDTAHELDRLTALVTDLRKCLNWIVSDRRRRPSPRPASPSLSGSIEDCRLAENGASAREIIARERPARPAARIDRVGNHLSPHYHRSRAMRAPRNGRRRVS